MSAFFWSLTKYLVIEVYLIFLKDSTETCGVILKVTRIWIEEGFSLKWHIKIFLHWSWRYALGYSSKCPGMSSRDLSRLWISTNFYKTFRDYCNVYLPGNNYLWGLYREGKINKDELDCRAVSFAASPALNRRSCVANDVSDDFWERTTHKTKLTEGTIDLLEYPQTKISDGYSFQRI